MKVQIAVARKILVASYNIISKGALLRYFAFIEERYGFYSINSSMLGYYELFDVSKPIESVI